MPGNVVPAVVGIAVLVMTAAFLDWLSANPLVLVGLAAVAGGAFFWWQRRRSHW